MLANYLADTTSFQNMMTKGAAKKSKVATYTANLKAADKKMMDFLKNVLDNATKQWKKTAPDFVNTIKNARKIINYGNPHSGVNGHISNIVTHQKLKNMIIEIPELNLLTSSGNNGYFEFNNVPEGTYTLRFRGIDYITSEIPVKVEKAKITTVNYQIEHKPVPESVPA